MWFLSEKPHKMSGKIAYWFAEQTVICQKNMTAND